MMSEPDPVNPILDLALPSFLQRSKLMETLAMAKPMKDITPTEEPAHATLGASGNNIWLNCQGQPNLVKKLGLKSPPNEYSAQGSAAHEIAAQCLNGREPWEFAGDTWEHDGFSGEVDDEMVAGIQLYVDTVLGDGRPDDVTYTEFKVGLTEFHPDLWGTLDAAKVSGNLLRVYDFKYGVGHVDVEDNTQLKQYGASLVNDIHADHPEIEWVEFVIVQPRGFAATPVRRWKITVDALGEWMGAVLVPGAKATDKPDAPLNFGSWCRWCPANSAKSCSKIRERVGGIMNAVEKAPTTEVDAQTLDDWEIAEQLDLKAAVMKHFATLEAEAFTRLMNGGHIPGQKLVLGITRRVWKDGAEEQVKAKLGADALTEPTLKSPAQIEKLGKLGKNVSAEWAFKPEGQLTIASADDRRSAVTPRDVGSILNSD